MLNITFNFWYSRLDIFVLSKNGSVVRIKGEGSKSIPEMSEIQMLKSGTKFRILRNSSRDRAVGRVLTGIADGAE